MGSVLPPAPVLLLVAIAVEGADADASARVVSACQAALGSAACLNAAEPSASEEPLSAHVRMEDAALEVTVEAGDGERVVRELTFAPEDSAEQRAIAAGLLVAALAADLERAAAARALSAPPVRPPPPPPPVEIAPPPPAEVDRPRTRLWLLDVGAYTSLPAGALTVHLGGQAQVGYFLGTRTALLLGARGDTAILSDGLDASRLGLSLGAGVELLPRARTWSWLVALEGRIEELRLGGGLSEPLSASVLRGGGSLGTRLGFPSRGAGFYVGLEGALLGPPVDVYVGTEPVGQVPMLSFSLLVGGRLASFRP